MYRKATVKVAWAILNHMKAVARKMWMVLFFYTFYYHGEMSNIASVRLP